MCRMFRHEIVRPQALRALVRLGRRWMQDVAGGTYHALSAPVGLSLVRQLSSRGLRIYCVIYSMERELSP